MAAAPGQPAAVTREILNPRNHKPLPVLPQWSPRSGRTTTWELWQLQLERVLLALGAPKGFLEFRRPRLEDYPAERYTSIVELKMELSCAIAEYDMINTPLFDVAEQSLLLLAQYELEDRRAIAAYDRGIVKDGADALLNVLD